MQLFKIFGRLALVAILFVGSSVLCIAQNTAGKMGKIAILSFNGGSPDEREGIAELFSFTPQIMDNFVVIPRTTITNAIASEQRFQMSSGMTDADTIAAIGNQLGAEFVMSGTITRLGKRNLLIVSIVKIDVIQQVAGDFLIYDSLDELNAGEALLNTMSGNLVSLMKKKSTDLDKLAVVPVQFTGGANEQEGDALAQLLSIYLIQNGKYAVYPRTKTLDQVQKEYRTQMSGVTREDETVSLGRGVNPPYALSVVSRKIGSGYRFNASIMDLAAGSQIDGGTEQYADLSDGMNAIDFLAKKLSGITVSERERRRRTSTVEDAAKNEEQARTDAANAVKRAQRTDNFLKNSGISFGGWFGVGYGPDYINHETTYTDSETGEEKQGTVTTPALSGGGFIELRLFRWFGVQSGFQIIGNTVKYGVSSPIEVITTTMQVPLLAKLNLQLDLGTMGLYLAPYGGIGLNISSGVSKGDAESKTFSSLSYIIGGEVGFLWGIVAFFFDAKYNADFSDSVLHIYGMDYSYKRTGFTIGGGIRIYLPFRKK